MSDGYSAETGPGSAPKSAYSGIELILKPEIKPDELFDFGKAKQDTLSNFMSRDVAATIIKSAGEAILDAPNDYFRIKKEKEGSTICLKEENISDLATQLINTHYIRDQISVQQEQVAKIVDSVLANLDLKERNLSDYFSFRVTDKKGNHKDYATLGEAVKAVDRPKKIRRWIMYGALGTAIIASMFVKDCRDKAADFLGYTPEDECATRDGSDIVCPPPECPTSEEIMARIICNPCPEGYTPGMIHDPKNPDDPTDDTYTCTCTEPEPVPGSTVESEKKPACDDGIDNDGDGKIDYNGGPNGERRDPGCRSLKDNNEWNSSSGGGNSKPKPRDRYVPPSRVDRWVPPSDPIDNSSGDSSD